MIYIALLLVSAIVVYEYNSKPLLSPSLTKEYDSDEPNAPRELVSGVSGLVNLGNTCFMNSVLQILASNESYMRYLAGLARSNARLISKLDLQLSQLHSFQTNLVIHELLSSMRTGRIVNPVGLVHHLSAVKHAKLLYSGQQDAHEFYHVVTGCECGDLRIAQFVLDHGEVDERQEEKKATDTTQLDPDTLTAFLANQKRPLSTADHHPLLASVFTPLPITVPQHPITTFLIGRQLICQSCSYASPVTSGVESLLSITAPQKQHCRIEELISNGFMDEFVDDYWCWKCSAEKTLGVLKQRLGVYEKVEDARVAEIGKRGHVGLESGEFDDVMKKKRKNSGKSMAKQRITELLNQIAEIEQVIATNNADIKLPVYASKVYSRTLRRSCLLTQPKVLVIHVNRSQMGRYGAQKNECVIDYNNRLLLSSHSEWMFKGDHIKSLDSTHQRRNDSGLEFDQGMKESVYRLTGIVHHIGGHDSGHYYNHVKRGGEWFRVSDRDVQRVESVRKGNEYMFMYSIE